MIDPHSETWRDVTAFAEREAAISRAALEAVETGPDLTNFHRGRLAALRALTDLTARRPTIPTAPTSYT
jgi:hypothetical protein